jgi:hypothetical protein
MHFNTLDHLRQQSYRCFERSRDALFNLSDALLSESQARSLPELSLSAFFERRWPSVYEALQDGRIDTKRLREVIVQALLVELAQKKVLCKVGDYLLFNSSPVQKQADCYTVTSNVIGPGYRSTRDTRKW